MGEIVEKPITQEDLTRGLRADGFSTMLGGVFNAFPYTAFAQNVGLVGLTRVKSRYVVAAAGIILIILGLFPKAAALVASVPTAVLGGAGIAMFGMVIASGIKTLSKVRFEGTHNLMVVAISIAVGLIPLAVPGFYQKFPSWSQVALNSGISAGSIVAIILNAVLNGSNQPENEPPVRPEYLTAVCKSCKSRKFCGFFLYKNKIYFSKLAFEEVFTSKCAATYKVVRIC